MVTIDFFVTFDTQIYVENHIQEFESLSHSRVIYGIDLLCFVHLCLLFFENNFFIVSQNTHVSRSFIFDTHEQCESM